ncbi:MAG: hypothetical protein VB861_07490, partial [Planctomycetaceae bacterium]
SPSRSKSTCRILITRMSTPAFCTYAEEHPDWVCYIDEHPDAAQDSKLQGEHRYDGVIARVTLPMQRGLKRLGIPLVKPLLPQGLFSWAAVASSMVTPLSADDGK